MTDDERYSAYTTASHMVRKTKQVVMLYDGAIRSIQQAKAAIKDGRIEDRYNALVKACDIITGLQLSLDFNNAGEISKTLYDYYAAMDMRLLSVHQSQDTAVCDMCIKHLKMMREVWNEIDHSYEDAEKGPSSEDEEFNFADPKFVRPMQEAANTVLSVSA